MSDELKHECAVAMVVLRKPPSPAGDYGGAKLSLLLEKQHNRGQDGAGAAVLRANPEPGEKPYWIAKSASATPLADVLGAIAKRENSRNTVAATSTDERHETEDVDGASLVPCLTSSTERIFLGHLRYATFGKNDVAFCHPFVHESSDLAHTLLLAGNFNLTNAHELFEDYSRHGSFPTSKADGYLVTELVAKQLANGKGVAQAVADALSGADGAWTLCGATGDGWAFATRDPCGIRPGFCYVDENVVVAASERPAIQAAFDVPPEAVKELSPGQVLVVSPDGEVCFSGPDCRQQTGGRKIPGSVRPCSFERIYFSRANDADIHRERRALGAALLPHILEAAGAPVEDIFFSYIPNSARIAFHGLIERLFDVRGKIRFGEVIVKDAKFRTFIANAAARREFYKHVYDVTYGLVGADDTLVVLDDSIVRGNTMKNAILPMLDRLGPKRIVVASSAPPIRFPDCYGIDMSTLGELVAFKALVNLLDAGRGSSFAEAAEDKPGNAERELREALEIHVSTRSARLNNPLAALYARFTGEQHCAEIARLLTPPGMKAEVKVVYQTVEDLRKCLGCENAGDWYFTGDYPTPGGYKVLRKALANYLERKNERAY